MRQTETDRGRVTESEMAKRKARDRHTDSGRRQWGGHIQRDRNRQRGRETVGQRDTARKSNEAAERQRRRETETQQARETVEQRQVDRETAGQGDIYTNIQRD